MDLKLSTKLWVAEIIFGLKRDRMSLIAETMEQLQIYFFLHSSDVEVFFELFDKIDQLVIMMRDPSENQVNIISQ